ncbi:hypothetical protein ACGFZL_08055 [Streptomyces sp. NPDC048182]
MAAPTQLDQSTVAAKGTHRADHLDPRAPHPACRRPAVLIGC